MKIENLRHRSPRQWRAAIGLDQIQFNKLLIIFELSYINKYNSTIYETFDALSIQKPILPDYASCLFFVLFQIKNGLTFDVLGCIYGTDASNAQRNFERYLILVEMTLIALDCVPKREFSSPQELVQFLQSESQLLIDGTEFPIQRPQDRQTQKDTFSGKKK